MTSTLQTLAMYLDSIDEQRKLLSKRVHTVSSARILLDCEQRILDDLVTQARALDYAIEDAIVEFEEAHRE